MHPGLVLRNLTGLRMLLNASCYRGGGGRVTLVMAETDAEDCIEALRSAEGLIEFFLPEEAGEEGLLTGWCHDAPPAIPATTPEGDINEC